jgi:DNA-binding NtrC family response regulator
MNEHKQHNASILIVESDLMRLTQLTSLIEPAGWNVIIAHTGEQALDMIEKSGPSVILLDNQLPRMDGFETCSRLKQHQNTRAVPILFIKAQTENIDYRKMLAVGSVGIITKPFQSDEVLMHLHVHIAQSGQSEKTLAQENEQLKLQIKHQQSIQDTHSIAEAKSGYQAPAQPCDDGPLLIGQSSQINEVLKQILRFSNTPLNVLVVGESGTGKELIARALHKGSAYATGPFVPVNCSAVPMDLAEAEWFGSMRGAFTGAVKDHKGYFEQAEGGTLFLDEIGEMPLLSQAKLLRALEHREIQPIGGTRLKPTNIRVIAATNANLLEMIRAGTFRQDLYFRLAGHTLKSPPLRERKEDIALSAKYFLNPLNDRFGPMKKELSQPALKALESYSFPGNVRELKHLIEQAFFDCDGNTIQPEHLHFIETPLIPESQQIPPFTLPTPEKQQPQPLTAHQRFKIGSS